MSLVLVLRMGEINKRIEIIKNDPTAQKYFNIMTRGITRNFVNTILNELKDLEINSLLDVGCGTGYITNEFAKYFNFCVGCDLDMNRILLARKYIGNHAPLIVANAVKLPFKDSSFDIVTAIEVVEHVIDINSLLEEFSRVSRKYVLITVPNEPLFRIMNFLRGKNIKRFGDPEDHVHHFNKKTLEKLLSNYYSRVNVSINSYFWLMAICYL